MAYALAIAFVVFVVVGVVLSIVGVPYAWLIALALGILAFVVEGGVRRRGGRAI